MRERDYRWMIVGEISVPEPVSHPLIFGKPKKGRYSPGKTCIVGTESGRSFRFPPPLRRYFACCAHAYPLRILSFPSLLVARGVSRLGCRFSSCTNLSFFGQIRR